MNIKLTIIDDILEYFSSLKEKVTNLSDTNYQLGLNHLENGHIWEALSRFKIIRFFWPHNYKASYQYTYCLVLVNKVAIAKNILKKLVQDHPNYIEAIELLKAIEMQDIDKIKQDYKAKLLQ